MPPNAPSSLVQGLYPYSGLPGGSPYLTPDKRGLSNIQSLPVTGTPLRNISLANILAQLQGPSFEGIYAAPGMDQLAQQYRQGQRSIAEGSAGRGLDFSGLIPTEERGLSKLYSQGVLSNTGAAANQEDARKRALLQALLGIGQADLSTIGSIDSARLGTAGANLNADITKLQGIKDTLTGAINIAALAVGGGLGASGGLGGLGGQGGALAGTQAGSNLAAGGVAGGLTGANLFSQAGGLIGGNQQQQQSPLLGSLQPTPTTPSTNYSPYGPYYPQYQYDPSFFDTSLIEEGRIGY